MRTEPSKTSTGPEHERTIDEHLAQNTKLTARLQRFTGMDPHLACQGFRNFGQCVATANAAHNLSIPFSELKARMTGTNDQSLGEAIHALRPNVNATAAAHRAERQADDQLRSTDHK